MSRLQVVVVDASIHLNSKIKKETQEWSRKGSQLDKD